VDGTGDDNERAQPDHRDELMLDRFAIQAAAGRVHELEAARELARGSLEQLRALVRGLRPAGLDELGLTATLTALTRHAGERTGLMITRNLDRVPADVDPAAVLVNMPRLNGLQAARKLARRDYNPAVVMLSMHDDEQFFFEAPTPAPTATPPTRTS
jgi:CheY-like chemotaxis protein